MDASDAVVFIGGVTNKTIIPSTIPELAVPFRGAVQRLTIDGHTFSELFKVCLNIRKISQFEVSCGIFN